MTKKTYKDFIKQKAIVLNRCINGSYFHGKPVGGHSYSIESVRSTAKYIARYASHPAISERRIISYDTNTKKLNCFIIHMKMI